MKTDEALALVSRLVKATSRHTLLVNTMQRGSADKAAKEELVAAKAVLRGLLSPMVLTDEEIEKALY